MSSRHDWWPWEETGILGHGHDCLVIDRIKHTETPPHRAVALVAQATLWSLEHQALDRFPEGKERAAVLDFLLDATVPPELYV